jgi:hypothetical protein
MFLKLFCDICEGNYDIKHQRTAKCGVRRGEWDLAQIWLTGARGITTLYKCG